MDVDLYSRSHCATVDRSVGVPQVQGDASVSNDGTQTVLAEAVVQAVVFPVVVVLRRHSSSQRACAPVTAMYRSDCAYAAALKEAAPDPAVELAARVLGSSRVAVGAVPVFEASVSARTRVEGNVGRYCRLTGAVASLALQGV